MIGRSPLSKGPWRVFTVLAALNGLLALGLAWGKDGLLSGAGRWYPLVPWPLYDEAINGYYALQLDQHWSWRPFFFFSQLPPFYIWLLSLLHRMTGDPLLGLRLEPLLLWVLTFPTAYFAARPFLDRRNAGLFTVLSGLGFGGLFFSNISHQAVLLLPWEYLLMGCLGRLGADKKKEGPWTWAAFGLLLGTGFYTYFAWPLVALWAGIIAFLILARKKGHLSPNVLFAGVPFLLALFPMAHALIQGGYGSYFRFLWTFKPGNDWSGQVHDLFWTLSSFLWGDPSHEFTYGPVWGGFFNPLAGAAVILGLTDLYRRRREGVSRAFFLGLGIFLLPALATRHVTLVREITVLPLLTFAAVLGLRSLFAGWKGRKGALGLGLFLCLSIGLDLVHLAKAGNFLRNLQESQKTVELERAYQALDGIQNEQGPGWILTAFSNDLFTYDRSLSVACYPFNLAQNPRLDPNAGNWTAVVTNIHLRPFLQKRFPNASFQWLSDKDHAVRDDYNGGLMLMTIPGRPSSGILEWIEWDRRIRGISDAAMELPVAQARRKTLADLEGILPALPKDPFLRSCYWEMLYTGYNWENRYGGGNIRENFPRTVAALRAGITEGYPTAYFLNELGTCYAILGDQAKAKEFFQKAVRAPLDLTPAAENLGSLGRPSGQGKGP